VNFCTLDLAYTFPLIIFVSFLCSELLFPKIIFIATTVIFMLLTRRKKKKNCGNEILRRSWCVCTFSGLETKHFSFFLSPWLSQKCNPVFKLLIPVAVWSRPWVYGRSHPGIVASNPTRVLGVFSLVRVVFCQIEVSASDWSLVQRSPTECGVTKWMRSWSINNEETLAP
jgi:hypothetical protein